MQLISRKGTFDAGHRVMNERMKCFNLHGHTYTYKLNFQYDEMKAIGYAIDFKEIKRVGCQWIDDYLDHAFIANPHDIDCITAAVNTDSKLWLMSLNGEGKYCNPTAENIAKEILMAMDVLFVRPGLRIFSIDLNETPNCSVCTHLGDIPPNEHENWNVVRGRQVDQYRLDKGVVEYDDRLPNSTEN